MLSADSDPWFLLAEVVVFLCLAGLAALLPTLHPVPIIDISVSRGRLVVTTGRPHRMRSAKLWLLAQPRLVVWGTHDYLIDRQNNFRVKVLNSTQLMIAEDPGFDVSVVGSSMGFCRLMHPWSMIWTHVYGVPVAVAVIVQLLLVSVLTFFGAFRFVLLAPAATLGLSSYVCQWGQTSNPLRAKLL